MKTTLYRHDKTSMRRKVWSRNARAKAQRNRDERHAALEAEAAAETAPPDEFKLNTQL